MNHQQIIVDTGALVAYLNYQDTFHQWAKKPLTHAKYPLLTGEAVISETWFLLNKRTSNPNVIMQMLEEGLFTILNESVLQPIQIKMED